MIQLTVSEGESEGELFKRLGLDMRGVESLDHIFHV